MAWVISEMCFSFTVIDDFVFKSQPKIHQILDQQIQHQI